MAFVLLEITSRSGMFQSTPIYLALKTSVISTQMKRSLIWRSTYLIVAKSVAVNPRPPFLVQIACLLAPLNVQLHSWMSSPTKHTGRVHFQLYTGKTTHKYTSIDEDGVSFDPHPQQEILQSSRSPALLQICVLLSRDSSQAIWLNLQQRFQWERPVQKSHAALCLHEQRWHPFVVGKKEFHAHEIILSARSPMFAATFQHDMKEAALNRVKIIDVAPDIFQAVLRLIYTDKVDLTSQNSVASLSVANRFNLGLLKWKSSRCKPTFTPLPTWRKRPSPSSANTRQRLGNGDEETASQSGSENCRRSDDYLERYYFWSFVFFFSFLRNYLFFI